MRKALIPYIMDQLISVELCSHLADDVHKPYIAERVLPSRKLWCDFTFLEAWSELWNTSKLSTTIRRRLSVSSVLGLDRLSIVIF